ncbi:NUDIX hydrolase [Pseudonocardia humida]|uniref:NUDIX hydrolase n=1 Tax=Pseudonocardia humida TaxID=2800819 RepID=A0ABT0ZRY3_9PSEU|nr:NUDIX hydrolase [Pseudonocardia humida]MCO1653475.1 NUDIX hydrolase [Pseudonocardia humida]
MAVLLWVLIGLLAVLLGGLAALTANRVRRLDRLHVRMDAARSALVAALDRRALAAARAGALLDPTSAAPLAAAVDAATAAGTRWPEREAAENRLGRLLAGMDRSALPRGPAAELVEAEQLLALARRVHNDAVRDTLGLRSRWLVRHLHLAGRAPLPRYFEIADPVGGVTTTAPTAADWS